jgi:signal transduction histidine kinase
MDLKSHRFISYFQDEQATELCQVATVRTFANGTLVFEENEIPDSLYLVLDGEVEFSKSTGPNQYQTIAWAHPNDFFGEFGVLDGQPRSARAVARGETILAKIPRDQLMEILERTPGRVVLQLFSHIIHYLRITTDQYVHEIMHKQKMAVIGEMVNTIVHDFKSPFTGIQLSSSMLREIHEDDEETQEWCHLIEAQVTRMLGMAEELLEFTRGTATLHKKQVKLADILEKFEKLNRIYLQDAQVELFIKVADKIVVDADDNKLIRVFQNLVSNGVDAFDGAGGRIEIIAEETNQWVTIKISDNGPGIPEEIQERLFEAFVTYGKRGGTGLGTAIARSLITAHGGDITFNSNSAGTTFFIRLPLIDDLIDRQPE